MLVKRMLYGSTILLWLSGLLWLYFKYFGQVQGDYGTQASPAQPVLLDIHGAAYMFFLIVWGMLFIHRTPGTWTSWRNHRRNLLFLLIGGLLTVTGWGLYYVADEDFRQWIIWLHVIAGLLLPVSVVFYFRHHHPAKTTP